MASSFSLCFLSLTVKCGGLYASLMQCGLARVNQGAPLFPMEAVVCQMKDTLLAHANSCNAITVAHQILGLLRT